jgi:ElaB/YqjD/DUF883 family membrane-anchored ribosome-binding protein
MINQQTLLGNWNEIKGELRKHWAQLSNDELQSFQGNVDELVGLIQRKTGEARSAVEDYLNQLTAKGGPAIAQGAQEVRQYVQHAAERIQQQSQQAAESLRESYEDAEDFVRQRPSESVAVCFGVGLFVGLVLGISLRGR